MNTTIRTEFAVAGILMAAFICKAAEPAATGKYIDGRPEAVLRLDAEDAGVVLRRGQGPDKCDTYCIREAIVYQSGDTYYLHYDGAGEVGWLACLATSKDLVRWKLHGPVLDLGKPGQNDSAGACSPWVIKDGDWWHMFYLGTPNASPPPERVPRFPYLTLKARSRTPEGPWEKQYDVTPFSTKPGTYRGATASPGHVVKQGDEFLMFFSASTPYPDVKRTLSIARTKDLNGPWTVADEPIVPLEEQVENSSVYYEPSNQIWFLFTNHIGINKDRVEFTDSIWVYWTKDLENWDSKNKAVVLDGQNCTWSKVCIGMPSVVRKGDRLAIFYDAPGGDSMDHVHRDIGLAWLKLPLQPPTMAEH